MKSTMRPEEQAAEADVERHQRLKKGVGTAVKTAAGAAGAVGAVGALGIGAALGSKIMPFLSAYIPVDLAVKGINKLSPQLGKFLNLGQSKGLNPKDGLDFIKKQIGGSEEEPKAKVKQAGDPGLEQLMDAMLADNVPPEQVVDYIRDVDPEYASSVEQKLGRSIEDLVMDYVKTKKTNKKKASGLAAGLETQLNQAQATPQAAAPQQGQDGPGLQKLLGAIQAYKQARG